MAQPLMRVHVQFHKDSPDRALVHCDEDTWTEILAIEGLVGLALTLGCGLVIFDPRYSHTELVEEILALNRHLSLEEMLNDKGE